MSLRSHAWKATYGPGDSPLESFFIPALAESVRYDRSAGFFSSSALAVAAAGVAGLIQNGGTMRLLVGAQLDEADVRAIAAGELIGERVRDRLLAALELPEDEALRRRVQLLAWLVAADALSMRVVVPRDPVTGHPVAGSHDYYHTKKGIFTDAEGNRLAFMGSINESLQAWKHNYEEFAAFCSWKDEQGHVAATQSNFEKLWAGAADGWISVAIPEAVRERLITYAPEARPAHDPLDPAEVARSRAEAEARQRAAAQRALRAQYLLDAPFMPNAAALGEVTSAITPYPHQRLVSAAVVARWPKSYLLCDEVGLGKTIEAGLILRQLWITRQVKRALLLAPSSVCRQWQEELYEKFGLDVPFYEQGKFSGYGRKPLPPVSGNPWNAYPLMIASSQLAKREERQAEVLAANAWDLIIVDEAHHARRTHFNPPTDRRSNKLLALLNGLREEQKTRAFLLMTATPMQVHPLEVWDLLRVLGLEGRWADEANFLAYYEALATEAASNWGLVFAMLCDLMERDTSVRAAMDSDLQRLKAKGAVKAARLRDALERSCGPGVNPREAQSAAQTVGLADMRQIAERHTPVKALMFRNTRDLLREYHRQGLIKENVPTRAPRLIWIDLTPEERALYGRIDEYITYYYKQYETERPGLGFIMTVYRRRLTSSFHAIQESLKRRQTFLAKALTALDKRDQLPDDAGLVIEEDEEDADLDQDVSVQSTLKDLDQRLLRGLYEGEIGYIASFLHDLSNLGGTESKAAKLIADVNEAFLQFKTILVFTQYTDTMDFLRDRLVQQYGTQVACYSGRGGEIFDGKAWKCVTKDVLKAKFRQGDEIKLLLATEAASEGLNLQTCGILINYDMPWNPMRVEQRIGRIDRIGQLHAKVQIRNYFYEDTVEADIYRALEMRINWFQGVVGQLQPILSRVGQDISRVAMLPREERASAVQQMRQDIEAELAQHDGTQALNIWQGVPAHEVTLPLPPVTLGDLERVASAGLPELPGMPEVYVDANECVTFSPTAFDQHPTSVEFLTYGNLRLEERLAELAGIAQSGPILRLAVDTDQRPVVMYFMRDESGVRAVETFTALEVALAEPAGDSWGAAAIEEASRKFTQITGLTYVKG